MTDTTNVTEGDQHLADHATTWMDQWYDPAAGLLVSMPGSFDDIGPPGSLHLVPQSAWYALGLARRGDTDRLATVLGALCNTQYRAPGEVWDGTFARFLEWPTPTASAVEWVDYDPNWRQFLGTCLTMLLRRHGDHVDAPLRQRVEDTIGYAVASEPEDRVHPSYTNIALKKAWLDVEWGFPDRGEALAGSIVERHDRVGAFEEFNSPTYDGIDLWALGLWRAESSSGRLQEWGARLEASLWERIGERYHAGLRNIAGPYTRAYGMDMERYLALVALWVAASTGVADAPLPPLDTTFRQAHGRVLIRAAADRRNRRTGRCGSVVDRVRRRARRAHPGDRAHEPGGDGMAGR